MSTRKGTNSSYVYKASHQFLTKSTQKSSPNILGPLYCTPAVLRFRIHTPNVSEPTRGARGTEKIKFGIRSCERLLPFKLVALHLPGESLRGLCTTKGEVFTASVACSPRELHHLTTIAAILTIDKENEGLVPLRMREILFA